MDCVSAGNFDEHFTDLQASRPNFVLGDDATNVSKGSDTAAFTGKLSEYSVEVVEYTTATSERLKGPRLQTTAVWSTMEPARLFRDLKMAWIS